MYCRINGVETMCKDIIALAVEMYFQGWRYAGTVEVVGGMHVNLIRGDEACTLSQCMFE